MYIPKSFMVVTPHPDDAELGCGGTISKWISEGASGVSRESKRREWDKVRITGLKF